ncbi:hypothetical protein HNQ02_003307 [Flavobacterium sp. 7E]|uniref:hypothetical protein n=1 Tax=Flavobacterium sp. 7E TaxID=2735898 RepID=UPI00156F2BDC|nr:hypothetical protein [Flavobacterium sp. 7E]NRS90367.1 hypothetical protein [Flavobacterium sp. 7E]
MRNGVLLLTTFLMLFTACNQTKNQENSVTIDVVTNKIDSTQAAELKINTLDTVQTTLGIGLVSINFDDKTILHFYTTPTEKKPKRTIIFFDDQSINSWNIRDLDQQKEWLKPEILWLDYSKFVFRCVRIEDNWLKVIVNNETEETLWLEKSELTTFIDWENYLKNMFGVARLSDQKQKIRSLPTDDSEEIIYQGNDCFQVKAMKGDWIQIFTAEYCDANYTDSKTKIKSGWIKWRQGNKLLIEYFTTS